MPQSKKKIGLKIFNRLIIIAAYAYLVYTFATFEDYPALQAYFRSCGWAEYSCLMLAVLLVPLNFLCEAWKWKFQLRKIAPMTIAEAQRQTYFGFVGAFLTPERLGDYPTRVTRIEDRKQWLPAITLGFVGSMALSSCNVLCGLISFSVSQVSFPGISKHSIAYLGIGVLALFVLANLLMPYIARRLDGKKAYGPHKQAMIDALKHFSPWEFPVLVGISLCRYLVYATQLLLVLVFCGIKLRWDQYITIIPIHYLFVTLIPTMPVADAAVRGSIGVMIFSWYTDNSAAVAITFIMLWLINTMLPMLIGTLIRKKT